MTVKLLTAGLAGFAAGILAGLGLGYWHGFDAGRTDWTPPSAGTGFSVPSVDDIAAAYHQGNGGAS